MNVIDVIRHDTETPLDEFATELEKSFDGLTNYERRSGHGIAARDMAAVAMASLPYGSEQIIRNWHTYHPVEIPTGD